MGDRRAHWIAAWVALATIGGGGALAVWLAAASQTARTIPLWPAAMLAAVAAASVVMVFAPIIPYWPFRPLGRWGKERRLEDLYQHQRWVAGHYRAVCDNRHGIALALDPPRSLPGPPGRACIEVMRRQDRWLAFIEPEKTRRSYSYRACFPYEFAPAAQWPLPPGRYASWWHLDGLHVRHVFVVTQDGEVRHRARERARRWARRTLHAIFRGLPNESGQSV